MVQTMNNVRGEYSPILIRQNYGANRQLVRHPIREALFRIPNVAIVLRDSVHKVIRALLSDLVSRSFELGMQNLSDVRLEGVAV